MEALLTVAIEIGKALFSPLKRRVGYLVRYKRKVNDLGVQVDRLIVKRDGVQELVNAGRRRGEDMTGEVQGWLQQVVTIEENMRMLNDGVNENKRCFMGQCPDLQSRYHLGKEAAAKMAKVTHLQGKGDNFHVNNISVPPPPLPFSSLPAGDFQPFKPTEEAMEQVMNALKKDNVSIIGVYGMGGVGKTTLVEQVGRQVEKEKLFDAVIKVTVSQRPNLKNIQQGLAEKIGLELKEEEEDVRAGRLSHALGKKGKVLIMLDDLWDGWKFGQIGIPCPEEGRRELKIIITTRRIAVCRMMDCSTLIEVRVLSKEESWNLFKEKAGNEVETPELHTVASAVAEECAGLPLAIITVARALKRKKASIWAYALRELRKSTPTNVDDMGDKVFSRIKLSYEYLQSDEAQQCLLFCSLFPEDDDIRVKTLMGYMFGEGVFKNVDSLEIAEGIMEIAEGRMDTIIDTLKDSCLLLEGDWEGCVKLHDIVRDVCVSIASRDLGFLVRAGFELEWPENLEERRRLSLMRSALAVLPEQPVCPNLRTLLLHGSRQFEQIPDNFFQGLETLVVLDLSETFISALPPSFPCLRKLRVLNLGGCRDLTDITNLQGLRNLEILNLSVSGIKELPRQLGDLANLRVLDLTDTPYLQTVAPNIISRLSRLEELRMKGSFNGWEMRGINGDDSRASFADVASLARLRVLDVDVAETKHLSLEVPGPWEKLDKFHIQLCKNVISSRPYDRSLVVEIMSYPVTKWVNLLMRRSEWIELKCGEVIKELGYLDMDDFNSLKQLKLKKCKGMKHVIPGANRFPPNAFMSLEVLELLRMKNLERIWLGPIPFEFMGNLRKLTICMCGKLKSILLPNLLGLKSLERLEVRQCEELEEVFQCEEGTLLKAYDSSGPLLPRLTEISLIDLPKPQNIWKESLPTPPILKILRIIGMKSLCSPVLAKCLPQLEELEIGYCEMEKIISDEELMVPDKSNISATISLHPNMPTFPNLRLINIYECHGLKNLLSWNYARDLQKLECMFVRHCSNITDIITANEEVVDTDGILPCLKILVLESLPELTSVCYHHKRGGDGAHILLDWPSLETINVWHCNKLKRLPLGLRSAPKLEGIISTQQWFQRLEWEDESIMKRFEALVR